jgi:hypothetical protein
VKNRPRIFSRINEWWRSLFEYSWLHSWMVVHFAGMVRRVERLFESVLSEAFGGAEGAAVRVG